MIAGLDEQELWVQTLDGTRGYLGPVAVPYDGEFCQFPAIAETVRCLEKAAPEAETGTAPPRTTVPLHRLTEKRRSLRQARLFLQIRVEEEPLMLQRVDRLLRESRRPY